MQLTSFPKLISGRKYLSLGKLVKSRVQPNFFPKTHFGTKIFVVGKIGEKSFQKYLSLGKLVKNPMQLTFFPKTHFGRKLSLMLLKSK